MKTDQELANQLRDLLQRAATLADLLTAKGYKVHPFFNTEQFGGYWSANITRTVEERL